MARKIDRCRSLARTIVLTGFVAAGLPGVVWAQQGPVTGGAPTAIADNNLLAFHSDPTVLLTGNPNGGLLLISQVQQLTLADSSTFPKILQLIPAANEPQKRAIGEGLALASKVKILKDEQLAAEWQRQIMGSGDPIVVASATAAFGDVQIGGIGGGALGGDGGGPSTVASANRGIPTPAPRPIATTAFGYSPQTSAGPGEGAVPSSNGSGAGFTLTGAGTPGGPSNVSNPVSP